jgi:parallel beta-helix repeat protein
VSANREDQILDQTLIDIGGLMLHATTCSERIGKSHQLGELFSLGKYCVVIVSLILFFAEVQAQSGAWTKKQNVPTPRVCATACVFNDKIYVIGGWNSSDLAANEVYDPLTDTWEAKKRMPTPRGFASYGVVNDTIYVIGGGFPTPLSNVEAYDPVTDSWTTKHDMLSPRAGASAAVVDGIIYNVGGYYTQLNCESYDPSTNTWKSKTPMPEAGGTLSVTAYDGLVYAFGGGFYGSLSYYGTFKTVYAYNPQTDTWAKKTDMPTPRFRFGTYLVDGKIYAIGGSQAEPGTLATVEVYDPVSDTWETKSNMPEKSAYFTGAVVNGKIYVIGGTPDWTTGGSSVWEYDPAFHTDIAAGNVSGTWKSANSPYHINGEITIPNDSTLTIEPGVEVVFMGHYKFNVQGRLLAVGTQKDSIRFTAEDTQTGWHGIRFLSTPNTNDSSKIVYCSLKNGKANTGSGLDRWGGAITIDEFDKVLVSNCLFESNMNSGYMSSTGGAAICISRASPIVTKSTFSNNTGTSDGAIMCAYVSSAVISNNIFSNNTSVWGTIICYDYYNRPTLDGNIISNNVATGGAVGIIVQNGSNPRIINNVIIHNKAIGSSPTYAGGISCYIHANPVLMNNIIAFNSADLGGGIACIDNSKPILINNTIAYNTASRGGGIFCDNSSYPIFINSILYGNSATAGGNQVFIEDAQSDPIFAYCDIQDGKDGFAGAGAGVNYTGLYENNIGSDPLFMKTTADDFRLRDYSLSIGAGIDSTQIAGVWHYAPPFCIEGNHRPSPVGSRPDIGACENLLGSPLVGVSQELTNPMEFILYQNFPNPFNPSTTIRYQLPRASHVTLKVFNTLGQEVATLVNGVEEPGYKSVEFNASNLTSGVYCYRLQAGDFVQSKKLMMLK